MRKKIICLVVIVLSLCVVPNTVYASETPPINNTAKAEDIPEEIKIMLDRLNEIKSIEKSSLSRLEKKELRKEVRAIKKSIKASGNGIYISSGAIIIILLLIIIL
ncbi:hypothetical protein FPF71_03455 [Algibacter amylolyticus]|uniref:Seryl-tRNA synthetase n=1 Tax=Algibacter amylolyticus TaxID=1608400 RepID=A0A5M7BGH6_9FLAO|nr:hypothetical protein [Algibacter amylolyticus]KAA5827910.1 hypothetical protein F2B50_03455 [Algibacter amylolyticus]MBB5267143.1 hypothetical protein [Algibacter amylolyticus]TSJ82155.1 hypothetical protein FPF71_03455 [Algibacter amylolyticus]